MKLLEGQLALITGAGRGIGAGIAEALATAGAKVIIADRDANLAQNTSNRLRGVGFDADALTLDVTDRDAVTAAADLIEERHGPISILVNNAGVSGELPIEDQDQLALWDQQIAVNLSGPMVVTRAFYSQLRQTKGAVVNLASMSSFQAVTKSYSYQASKGGVKMLTQVMAKTFAADGIRVNAVAPGLIKTELTAKRMEDQAWMALYGGRIAMARPGLPEDLGGPVVFLCSSMAAYITGVTLPVDGGFLAV